MYSTHSIVQRIDRPIDQCSACVDDRLGMTLILAKVAVARLLQVMSCTYHLLLD